MKRILIVFLLFVASRAGAQHLSLRDMTELMDQRKDTAAVFRKIRSRGFTHRGRTEEGQVLFMGDPNSEAKRFTELVIVHISGDEVLMVQYGTRFIEHYKQLHRELANDPQFSALPTRSGGEPDEIYEGYKAYTYLLLIESIGKQSKYVISIRPIERSRRTMNSGS